jgi:hypothetical protein
MRRSDEQKLRHDAQAIAAAEQQAHGGGVVVIIIAKREGDARGRAPAPVLVLWLWNGIKMRIARLERVLRNERGAAIGGRRVLLILIEERCHDHSDVKSARRVAANLNVGVEERHVAEPLAERDALVDDAEYVCVRARYCH